LGAACSSSSHKAATSSATTLAGSATTQVASSGQANASASPTKSPIVIGTLDESTGVGSADLHFPAIVAPAAVKWINAHGGIDGHPLELHLVNTGGNPSNGIPDARRLVEQNHVVALVGNADASVETSYASYLTQKRIPVIGAEEDTGVWLTSPYFFPTTAGGDVGVNSFAYVAQKFGYQRIGGVVFANCPPCAQGVKITASIAPGLGLKVVSTQQVPFVSPSYTSTCVALKQAGAQFIQLALDTSSVSQLYQQCKIQSFAPFYGLQGSVADGTLGVGASKGIQAGGEMQSFPWWSDVPGAADFRAAMAQYAPGQFYQNPTATSVWTSFMILRQALQNVPLGSTVTSSDVLQGLYSIKNLTLGGLLQQPVSYSQSTPPFHFNCYFVVSQKDGSWTSEGTQCLQHVVSPFSGSS
jgi:branched-chain amino acid transport system substrate-binding protein